MAWAEGRFDDLLIMLRRATPRVIRRAHAEIHAMDPERGRAFRTFLRVRGIHIVHAGGNVPATIGSTRKYRAQRGPRQTFIRVPVDVIGMKPQDECWVTVLDRMNILLSLMTPEDIQEEADRLLRDDF